MNNVSEDKLLCNSGGIIMKKHIMHIREFIHNKSFWLKFRTFAIVLTLVLVMSGFALASYSEDISQGLAENIIRLHVIANSDSAEDQQLKLKVRDAVINYMEEKLRNSQSIEETRIIINDNIDEIIEVAKNVIKINGSNYDVKGMLGQYPFPTRMYGDVILPAGKYEALRIVIGEGGGANWWCVLFPPLCFVDASHGTIPDSVKNSLKNVLDEEEYSIATSAGSNSGLQINVKFKTVELFQKSKMKFTSFISNLFK